MAQCRPMEALVAMVETLIVQVVKPTADKLTHTMQILNCDVKSMTNAWQKKAI